MKTSEWFIVNEKVSFRLSDDILLDGYSALVKKTKENLLAIVVSNKDKNKLNLKLDADIFVYSNREGESLVSHTKLVQKQSYPLIILNVLDHPATVSSPSYEESEPEPEQDPATYPGPEIESINGDSGIDMGNDNHQDLLSEATPFDLTGGPDEPVPDAEDFARTPTFEELSAVKILDDEEDDLSELDLIEEETLEPLPEPLHEKKVAEHRDFFGVYIAPVKNDQAKKIGDAIESGAASFADALTLNESASLNSDASAEDDIERLFNRVSNIERMVVEIWSMATGGALSAPPKRADAVCLRIDTQSVRLVTDEPLTVGGHYLVSVDRPWRPGLRFTAVGVVESCETVNGENVAGLRFTAIHPGAEKSITEYLDKWREHLAFLESL